MKTLGSLFDGAGGFPFAAEQCGIIPVWASEIEAFPVEVTKKRFPNMKHLGDVTKINGAEIEPVDIITFGSPCQDLSVAGKRAGLDGERSGLFQHAIRIIKEMREKTNGVYPTFAIWENVPGAYSSNGGEDFRQVLQAFCEVVNERADIPRPSGGKWHYAGEIVADEYSLAWRTLDAQFWGVPQRRRRIFLVADFRGQRAGEILFEREGLSRSFAEKRESWKGITKSLAFCAGTENYGMRVYDARGNGNGVICPTITGDHENRITDYTAVVVDAINGLKAGTLDASYYKGLGARSGKERDFVAIAYALDRAAFNKGMNAQYDIGINGDGIICPTITGDHERSISDYTAVVVGTYRKTAHPRNSEEGQGWEETTVSDTLNVFDNSELRTPTLILCARERCGCDGGGKGLLVQKDVSATIATSNDQFLCYCAATQQSGAEVLKDVCPTITAAAGMSGNNQPYIVLYRAAFNQGVNAKYDIGIDDMGKATTLVARGPGAICYLLPCEIILRRLTPTECARLQGMPDWWCDDVPHSDSAEYKMWGNGMALPCVLYVMEGVAAALESEEAA